MTRHCRVRKRTGDKEQLGHCFAAGTITYCWLRGSVETMLAGLAMHQLMNEGMCKLKPQSIESATMALAGTARSSRMPAEWTPHERCLMAWPTRPELWQGQYEAATAEYAAVAQAIARFEPVLMVAAPGLGDDARRRCGPNVEVIELPIDESISVSTPGVSASSPTPTTTGSRSASSPTSASRAIPLRWCSRVGRSRSTVRGR